MHELLSFTMEKRLVTDHLTHFRREFVMPQKLMRLLLKHLGVFYVSERGKRFSVFLTGAYEGAELIQKCPLVLWKEKVLSLIGYRRRKKKIETFTDISDMEDNDFLEGNSEDEGIPMQLDQEEAISELEDIAVGDSSFMDIYEIDNEYKPCDSF
ncbi:protein WHAT'S THIS FACTOR 1 homolog, chloroplastic-like [Syzygium oleosum]|uniref:protein WHAT'S THIS FACTOR 1 homolog, chloroplastic-like n=1 Tax=Syzygium oleosum TaxID=219896 RepID=UPI0024B8E2DD|nr:protein WHAT'S THIS FACTOR 1 homolog, chloroplastic-like [Syzygium oleosum]